MFSRKRLILAFALATLFFGNLESFIAQTSNKYELKPGTKIRLQMDNEINSKSSSVDDTFTAVVSEPVRTKGDVVLPAGAVVEGRITRAEKASVGGKNGKLEVVFEKLTFEDGTERSIEAVLVNPIRLKSSRSKNILAIIGGTAIGAVIGVVTKVENGALIGAGIGGGAGTGVALARKGKEVRIKENQKFEIELKKKVTLPVEGF